MRFCTRVSRSMPSMMSSGSRTLPLDLDIFWPWPSRTRPWTCARSLERYLRGAVFVLDQVHGQHDHPGNPEENDVETGRFSTSVEWNFFRNSPAALAQGMEKIVHRPELNQVSSTPLSCCSATSAPRLRWCVLHFVAADMTRLTRRTRPECGAARPQLAADAPTARTSPTKRRAGCGHKISGCTSPRVAIAGSASGLVDTYHWSVSHGFDHGGVVVALLRHLRQEGSSTLTSRSRASNAGRRSRRAAGQRLEAGVFSRDLAVDAGQRSVRCPG